MKDIVIVRNDELNANIDEYLEATGLDKFITAEQVITVDERDAITPQAVLARIQKTVSSDATAKQVAIGAKLGIIDVDSDGAKDMLRSDSEDSMLLVQMPEDENGGLISQLYRMTLEIAAKGDQKPAAIEEGGRLTREGSYNMFTYLPKVEPVDMRKLREYEEMILAVVRSM